MLKLMKKFWMPVYEGEDDAAAASAAAAAASASSAAEKAAADDAAAAAVAAAKKTGSGDGDDDKKFSQKDLNRLLAEDKRKHQEKTSTLTNEIDALKAKNDLTDTERKDLESKNAELRKLNVTAEQLKKEDEKRLRNDYENQLTLVTKERDDWKTRFTTETIERSIIDASMSHDAFVPAQVVAILGPQTRLKEAVDDDGKPTGALTPTVSLDDIQEGKPITLELAPEEAVKRMTEMDQYLNLFKGKGAGGIGGSNRASGSKGGKMTMAQAAKELSPPEYRKWCKENGY